LIEKIAASESEIEIAVDEEDYDRAAELSEVVDASKEQLQAVCLTPLVFTLLSPPPLRLRLRSTGSANSRHVQGRGRGSLSPHAGGSNEEREGGVREREGIGCAERQQRQEGS
jgi:hypothetical protein